MRALLHDERGQVHLEEVPPPGELPAGFARVRVVCTMISPGTGTGNLLRLLQLGLVRMEPLITHTYPVERAAEAFEQIIRNPDQTLGVVLEW